MKTVEQMLPGTRVLEVAKYLVSVAPARMEMNGVWVRAKYATTRPEDVVAQYWRNMAKRWRMGIYARREKP